MTVGLVVAVIGVGQVEGATIYESATLGPTGQDTAGPPLNIHTVQFLATRFSTIEDFAVTGMGGHFSIDGSVFLAVVPIQGSPAFPASFSLEDAVIGEAVVGDPALMVGPAGPLSKEYFVTVPDVLLPAGTYALITGSGLFGATGVGWAPVVDSDLPQADYFIRNADGWLDGNLANQRFFIEGDVIPEPSTFVLLAIGAIGVAAGWWRRKRAYSGKTILVLS